MIIADLKGIVMDDFAMLEDSSKGVYGGAVYVKDLRSSVAVSVHGAPVSGMSAFKESRLIEMRGVLYEDGTYGRDI